MGHTLFKKKSNSYNIYIKLQNKTKILEHWGWGFSLTSDSQSTSMLEFESRRHALSVTLFIMLLVFHFTCFFTEKVISQIYVLPNIEYILTAKSRKFGKRSLETKSRNYHSSRFSLLMKKDQTVVHITTAETMMALSQ